MGHNGITVSEGVSYQIEVRYLEERVYRSRFVTLPGRPSADRAEGWQDSRVGFYKKPGAAPIGPRRKFIAASLDFIADFFGAQNQTRRVRRDEPLPERRTEIQTVVQVLGLNEHVGVQQVGHGTPTPKLRPSSLKVACFEKPSIRKASLKRVWPSSVLVTSAAAKRLLTRAACVK